MRLSWLSLPFTAGTLLDDALAGRSTSVEVLGAVVCWGAWAAVIVALIVRRPRWLTVLRVVAPAALAGSLWGATFADAAPAVVLTVLAAVPVALAFLPEIGQWMVEGAAYGDERRFPLRAPGALLLGPLPLAWLALVAGALAGPFLLAARQWVAGAVACGVGAFVVRVTATSLDALTQRWAVLVPAGVVLKDHVTLAEPVLIKRSDIESLAPAPAGTDALDLTAGAPGLALQATLREKLPMTIVVRGRQEQGASARFMFTPTRPGALLTAASAHRIAVPPPTTSSPS